MVIEFLPPPPLSEEERKIMQEIEASGAAKYQPRSIWHTRWTGQPGSWEGIFPNLIEYEGWLEANRLENEFYAGYDADILDVMAGGGSIE
ncbi:hypothetical protein NG99_01250 [Erwinia typographi]|uniref:Uncharacterized protein n=2 Tax=Erwinia typographi TaxID=371042 RepID=A0A0A3Z9M7_9GAMM|nr:hypothetical protein NG99_01250 [Erwinia typographi]